jgi:serine/threonine-protein kinase
MLPPRAPHTWLALEDAAVGKDYKAALPPFSDENGAKNVALRVEPNPPDGLTFVDHGAGFGEISGTPKKAGRFSFDVVASNGAGAARMTMKINVAAPAPQPAAPPKEAGQKDAGQKVAALEPVDKAARFVRNFDGGPCFFAKAAASAGGAVTIQGVGADKQTFERFYKSFLQDVGVEPALAVRLIAPPQCPAVRLIAADPSDQSRAPTIKLANYDVPRGKPLAGVVGALGGRRLDLLLIANDGLAHKILSRGASDSSAAFSMPITPDAKSVGMLQILVAVASTRPLKALSTFRSGPAADILPKIAAELGAGDAGLGVEYFSFLK